MAGPPPQIVNKDHFSALPAELRILIYSFLLPDLCKQQPELHLYGTNTPCNRKPDESWEGESEENIPQHLSFDKTSREQQPETSIYITLMGTCCLLRNDVLGLAPRFTLVLHAPPIKFDRAYVYPCCHQALPLIPWRHCSKVRLEMVNWQFTDNWNVFNDMAASYEESLLAELPYRLDRTCTTLIFLANRAEKFQDISFRRNYRNVSWDQEANVDDVVNYHKTGRDPWRLGRVLHEYDASNLYDPTIVRKTADSIEYFDGPADKFACSCRHCMDPYNTEAQKRHDEQWAKLEELEELRKTLHPL